MRDVRYSKVGQWVGQIFMRCLAVEVADFGARDDERLSFCVCSKQGYVKAFCYCSGRINPDMK